MEKQSLPKKPRPLGESQFLRCAELILPWVNAPELAAVSLTSKALTFISRSITLRRSLDAARSLESLPVPFLNAVDSKRYADFAYTPFQIPASSSPQPRQRWGGGASDAPASQFEMNVVGESMYGCECERCEEGYCQCLSLAAGAEIANECGSGCGCGSDCPNRVTQKGVLVRLKIVRDEKKGELLTTAEARRRQTIYDKLRSTQLSFSSALLVIREHLPSGQACLRINIDATRIGNVARFINHSCDGGNLSTVLLRSTGALLPRLCFFAARDIVAGEELSFSYGDVRLTPGKSAENKLNCSCGSSCCFGTLPCENT
ncbi:hypothetical protein Bca101_074411 [Brassica carinata]